MTEFPTTILLATDGTEDSERAANAAISLSRNSGAELHVAHVGRSAAAAAGATASRPALPGEPPGYAKREAEKLLSNQTERIRRAGGDVADVHLRMGRPAPEIVSLAARLGADTLVIGGGGPRRVRRAVAATTRRTAIGAVAEEIVRSAPCPVLVVRGEAFDDASPGDAGIARDEPS